MSNNVMQSEYVAIVGIGLTLPGGAVDAESYWQLMSSKRDATVEIPGDRWDARRFYAKYGTEKPGKMYVTRGGFLEQKVWEFDPLFFNISPREAHVIDPQQRLLLEVTVKTFQDAGLTEEEYKGSNMGVFVGGFCLDTYGATGIMDSRNWYISQSPMGHSATMLSNRISYVFNLRGPSLTVDTACSSSLVATHYAVQSILAGESDMALAGGVNIMTQPESFIQMCKGRLLSREGRCFTWDRRADGYARAEGAGMVLLKRLSAALRDNDHIYAVIKASGVNQDGTTIGVTLPNPAAQEELIRTVIERAGLAPSDIDYVEGHGTGTQAGDKAEATALNNVFRGRPRKLVIGSVKTNIGHLEAAAGVAGLIKAALSLEKAQIPPNIHFESPNPEIPFDQMCLQVPTEIQSWPSSGKTRFAGVSAFGYGGTNAHVILSNVPHARRAVEKKDDAIPDRPLALPLSAKSKESLYALARQYHEYLIAGNVNIRHFLRRVSCKRNHYDRRALIVANTEGELVEKLRNFFGGTKADGISCVETPTGEDRLVFVYSGTGPQWWGMGRELIQKEPVFSRKIEECDQIFREIAGWSLVEELGRSETDSRIACTEIAQPANFVIQVALTELFRSWGVTPAAVVGHSGGEVTAAFVSGALNLKDALLVAYHRSRLQGTLAGTGGTMAVGMSESEILPLLNPYGSRVSIAAVNASHAVTLAGDGAALEELAAIFQREGIFFRQLPVDVPFHSPLMAPIERELQKCLQSISPGVPTIPCASTVLGKLARAGAFDAAYWWRNVRDSVQFMRAVECLCDLGFRSYMEIGPHPVLKSSVKAVLSDKFGGGHVYTSLHRGLPEQFTLLNTLGQLYCQGHKLNWREIQPADDGYISLPAYPWQRKEYDYSSPKLKQDKFGEPGHPILYRNLAFPQPAWEVELSHTLFPYLSDHRMGGHEVLPGAFYVEAALALNQKVTGNTAVQIKNLSFERLLVVPGEMDEKEKRLVSMCDAEGRTFRIYSTTTAKQEVWERHAHGEYATLSEQSVPGEVPDIALRELEVHDTASFYRTLADVGLTYGPAFQAIRTLKSNGDTVYAELEVPSDTETGVEYNFHPAMLDGVFQTLFIFGDGRQRAAFVPVKIDRVSVYDVMPPRCKVVGRCLWKSAKSMKAKFVLFDDSRRVLAEIEGVTCQSLAEVIPPQRKDYVAMYKTEWRPFVPENVPTRAIQGRSFAILAEDPARGEWLKNRLAREASVALVDVRDQGASGAIKQAGQQQRIDTFIYLPDSTPFADDMLNHAVDHCARLTELVRVIDEMSTGMTVELLICTCNVFRVHAEDSAQGVSLSPLASLGRTTNTEYPHIKCSSVDMASAGVNEMELFVDAILCQERGIGEFAIRGNELYRQILVVNEEGPVRTTVAISREGHHFMADEFPVNSSNVEFKSCERGEAANHGVSVRNRELEDDEVEIEVDYLTLSRADELNRRLTAFPEDPGRTYFQYKTGTQCVGKIVRKGAAVRDLVLGDSVLSVYPHGVTNYSTVPAGRVVRLPKIKTNMLPDVYEIARARLAIERFDISPDRKVLLVRGRWGTFVRTVIDAGVAKGMKTLYVDEDSSHLVRAEAAELKNVHYVASDDGAWTQIVARMVMGVDVLVNEGWSDIEQCDLLNPFGVVVDFRLNQVDRDYSRGPHPQNGSYHLIDAEAIFRDYPAVARGHLHCIIEEFAAGVISPIHPREFRLQDVGVALNEIYQGKESVVGVRVKGELVGIAAVAEDANLAQKGTVIVAGGTRGFGLQCARWLARRGVRHIVLIGRRGLTGVDAQSQVRELADSGVTVRSCAVDIADREQLEIVLKAISGNMPPIKGVIHSAMVLDDGLMWQMNEARFRKVMSPKIQGAINLHQLLKEASLDFFVMFSSISSLLGNPGQANYGAANNFLNAFACYLSGHGIRARSISWGLMGDAGVQTGDANVRRMLEKAGILSISNEDALRALEQVLLGSESHVAVCRIEWKKWAMANPSLSESVLFSDMVCEEAHGGSGEEMVDGLIKILETPPSERKAYIRKELATKFGEIFKMSPDAIDGDASLIDIGLDSLMAAEISVALRQQLGVDISMIELLSGPSVDSLAATIVRQIDLLIQDVSDEIQNGGQAERTKVSTVATE